jgi:hypothetical protein
MEFRLDDPESIPENSINIVNDNVAFAYFGWKFGVTTDSGESWSIWDGSRQLDLPFSAHFGFIQKVEIMPNGHGQMIIVSAKGDRISRLSTIDFGRSWS